MNAAMTQFKQYLQRRYPGSSTTKHYMSDLNIFSRFVGDVSPKDITPKLIDQFIQEQSQQGKSAATINRRLSSLSSFIDFLIDDTEDDTWSNPVRWKRHAIKVGRHLPRDVSDETVSNRPFVENWQNEGPEQDHERSDPGHSQAEQGKRAAQ